MTDANSRDPWTYEEPARPWRGPLTLILLLLLGWATSAERALPERVELDAPDSAFSSGRAMLDVVEMAQEPHPPGSPHHDRVRELLVDRLEALGLDPRVQTTTSLRRSGDRVVAATVRNVLARVPGTASTGAVLVTAHYDGRGHARAAGDDGAGVAAILEGLRAFLEGPQPRNDLVVLLTDAEELGLLGARAFVREHPWLDDVAAVLSFEMRGGGGTSIMFETGAENGWIVDAFARGSPRPFANSISVEVYRRMPNDTDFSPFRDRGVQGLNFAGIDRAHVYHQAWDEPARFDERTLQHHGVQLLGMLRHLGDRDLSDVHAPDRAYFTAPLLGLVHYPTSVVHGLAVVLLLGFATATVLIWRRGGGAAGLAVGTGLAVAATLITAGAGYLLFRWVRRFHPELGSLHGSAFHVEGWYVSAVVAVGAAAVLVLLSAARRRFGLGELALGAAVPALAGGIALAFVAPLGAHNLQWPALLGLVGAALVSRVGPNRRPGLAAWAGTLLVAAGIAALAVPLTEFVWLALSVRQAALVGGLAATWLVLALPLLDALREPGGGWAPALAVVVAAACVVVGLRHARPAPERPAPSTLVYVLDRASDDALWAGRDGPGDAWAAARVGPLDRTRDLAGLLGVPGPWRTGSAPVADVPPPEAFATAGSGAEAPDGTDPDAPDADEELDPDGAPDPDGTLEVEVRWRSGAEEVEVRLPEDRDVRVREVNGVPVPAASDGSDAEGVRTVRHWGTPPGGRGIRLLLEGPDAPELLDGPVVDAEGEPTAGGNGGRNADPPLDGPPALDVVESHLRPGELVGGRWFLRPPSLALDITTRSDRAVIRTPVRVAPADTAGGDEDEGDG